MILQEGDLVRITGGMLADMFCPIPKGMIGTIAMAFETGVIIEEAIEAGSSWGFYTKRKLSNPVPEMRLRILSRGEYQYFDYHIDGFIFTKLSPLEVLAFQADE